MRRLFFKWDRWMMAVTFAEAGEWTTARSFLPKRHRRHLTWFERLNAAVAFAEGGLHDEALQWVQKSEKAPTSDLEHQLERLGISGIQMRFGVLSLSD